MLLHRIFMAYHVDALISRAPLVAGRLKEGSFGDTLPPISFHQVIRMRSRVVFASSAAALLALALTGCGDDSSPSADAAAPDAPDAPAPLDAAAPDAFAPDAGPVEYTKQTVELTATGISMQYVEAGNMAGAETVILLHGYTHSSRSFFPTIEALAALNPNLRIYALDLRGHGGSSMEDGANCPATPQSCFELSDFADDVFAFMDAKSITSTHLVGHALGSLVAQEIATTTPSVIESLVLISSSANAIDNPRYRDFVLTDTIEGMWRVALENDSDFGDWPQDAYNMTPRDADPNIEAWIAESWLVDPTVNADFLARMVPETADIRLGTWLGTVQMLLETNNSARLANLAVSSLIISATQDTVFPEDPDQAALRAALDLAAESCRSGYIWKEYGKLAPATPGAQDSDLGHDVLLAAPAQIAADVNAFITTGAPTTNLYFANPLALTDIETQANAARIITKFATNCGL